LTRFSRFRSPLVFLVLSLLLIGTAALIGKFQNSEWDAGESVSNSLLISIVPESTPLAGVADFGYLDRIEFQNAGTSMADGWATWRVKKKPQIFLRTDQEPIFVSGFTYPRVDVPVELKTLGFSVAVTSKSGQPFSMCVLVKKNNLYYVLSGSTCA
jgi:hypothetical protein